MNKLTKAFAVAGAICSLGGMTQTAVAGPYDCDIERITPFDIFNQSWVAIRGENLGFMSPPPKIEICDVVTPSPFNIGWFMINPAGHWIAFVRVDNELNGPFGTHPSACEISIWQKKTPNPFNSLMYTCDSEGLLPAVLLLESGIPLTGSPSVDDVKNALAAELGDGTKVSQFPQ